MAVYNVFIVCVVGVPLALFSDSQQHEIYFYVIASCIFILHHTDAMSGLHTEGLSVELQLTQFWMLLKSEL